MVLTVCESVSTVSIRQPPTTYLTSAMMMTRTLHPPSVAPEAVPPVTRVFHNAYPCLVRGSKSELAKNRDAAAFTEIMSALSSRGCHFESMIFNYAQTCTEDSAAGVIDDFQFLHRDDLLVMVTRPPLHDEMEGHRKYVPRSAEVGTERSVH